MRKKKMKNKMDKMDKVFIHKIFMKQIYLKLQLQMKETKMIYKKIYTQINYLIK